MTIFDNPKFQELLEMGSGVTKGEVISMIVGKSGVGKSAFNEDGTISIEWLGKIGTNCPNVKKAIELFDAQERLEHDAFMELLDTVEAEFGDKIPTVVRGAIDQYREIGGVGLIERE